MAYCFSVELLEVLQSTYILGPVTQRGAVNTITQMTARSQSKLRNGLWVLGNRNLKADCGVIALSSYVLSNQKEEAVNHGSVEPTSHPNALVWAQVFDPNSMYVYMYVSMHVCLCMY